MKATLIAILILIAGLSLKAQTQQVQTSDEQAVPTELMLSALEDWKQWQSEPTAANAYVGEFMTKYNVPQTPEGPLDLHKTWHWWMSHHNEELQSYYEMKQEAVK